MANDCSERICQFGLAHVDTPKGDLDASSGSLSDPTVTVATNSFMYPKGTTEQFPAMVDSNQNALTNTAHYYMECSNKGNCDRQSGVCQCFPGYDGSACQRASCPDTGSGVCSGHGTCESIKSLSWNDGGNIYKLWDQEATMACKCDGGYQGANCEEKVCKHGFDPLYNVWPQTVRYANWTYTIFTRKATTVSGNYSLSFTDATGEDWTTGPIDIAATCPTLVTALESLPNNVVPTGTVLCQKWTNEWLWNGYNAYTSLTGNVYDPVDVRIAAATYQMQTKFTIAFPGNPGEMRDLKVNMYLDGTRPTLYSTETTDPSLGAYVFNNGFYGETSDPVPDLCSGVKVTLNKGQLYDTLGGLTTAEDKLLRACLGDSDGDSTNNNAQNEVYNWDYGSQANPHLVKLVDATQDSTDPNWSVDSDPTHSAPHIAQLTYLCNPYTGSVCLRNNPPGFYAVLYFDGTNYRVLTRAANDYSPATEFYIYTTTGYLAEVNSNNVAFNQFSSMANYTQSIHSNVLYTHSTYASNAATNNGLDCETHSSVTNCLSKGDQFMVFGNGNTWSAASANPTQTSHVANPAYPQIYTVKKISREPIPRGLYDATASSDGNGLLTVSALTTFPTFVRDQIIADKNFNTAFYLDATGTNTLDTSASVYKFYPPTNAYNFAGSCAGRGVCDHNAGTCQCFSGFTSDSCGTIDALAQ